MNIGCLEVLFTFFKLWWLFGLIILIVDIINPYIGLFGVIFGGVALFILICLVILMKLFKRKKRIVRVVRVIGCNVSMIILLLGVIVRMGVFSVSSGFWTGTRIPEGVIFLFPERIEFRVSFLLMLVSIVFNSLMCISVSNKFRKGYK